MPNSVRNEKVDTNKSSVSKDWSSLIVIAKKVKIYDDQKEQSVTNCKYRRSVRTVFLCASKA